METVTSPENVKLGAFLLKAVAAGTFAASFAFALKMELSEYFANRTPMAVSHRKDLAVSAR